MLKYYIYFYLFSFIMAFLMFFSYSLFAWFLHLPAFLYPQPLFPLQLYFLEVNLWTFIYSSFNFYFVLGDHHLVVRKAKLFVIFDYSFTATVVHNI